MAEEALAGALQVLAAAFLPAPQPIIMTGKAAPKYTTLEQHLTLEQLADHLVGKTTYGGGLCWDDPTTKSGRAGRAIAWDSDDFGRLVRGGSLLRRRGIRSILVKNPLKPNCGHLFVFGGANWDPTDALARAEQIAACLRKPDVPERFPNPDVTGGHGNRCPAGVCRSPTAPPHSPDCRGAGGWRAPLAARKHT